MLRGATRWAADGQDRPDGVHHTSKRSDVHTFVPLAQGAGTAGRPEITAQVARSLEVFVKLQHPSGEGGGTPWVGGWLAGWAGWDGWIT